MQTHCSESSEWNQRVRWRHKRRSIDFAGWKSQLRAESAESRIPDRGEWGTGVVVANSQVCEIWLAASVTVVPSGARWLVTALTADQEGPQSCPGSRVIAFDASDSRLLACRDVARSRTKMTGKIRKRGSRIRSTST